MFQVYNFKSYDFKESYNGEIIYIIKSDLDEFRNNDYNHFTIDDFQEMVEYIRFCLIKFDYGFAKEPTHFERKGFPKEKFVTLYNKHLDDIINSKVNELNHIKEEDIEECYYLWKWHWDYSLYNSILAIAKTKEGYLAYDYHFTA